MKKQGERIAVLEEQVKEGFANNEKEHININDKLDKVCDNLDNLRTNHIIFKTRVMVYWAIGVGILSAFVQYFLKYITKTL